MSEQRNWQPWDDDDDGLEAWLASDEPETAGHVLGPAGLADSEFDSWLRAALAEAPGAPTDVDLVDRATKQRDAP